jgi:hypothetical protein
MKTSLYADLEKTIDEWLNKHCDDADCPNAYIYTEEAADMAQAAAIVFDASAKAQKFAEIA